MYKNIACFQPYHNDEGLLHQNKRKYYSVSQVFLCSCMRHVWENDNNLVFREEKDQSKQAQMRKKF